MSEKEAVTVKILDREYRLACAPEERRQLLDAADYLDRQMRELRENTSTPGVEKIAVLAALNITNDLLQARDTEKVYSETVSTRIQSLRAKLDKQLATSD